ncbi:MAG: BatA domain-containing protein [Cyclobacteriaceae bacterium]|nr:BatA domain-containing protein [Cyclobacteriaceae bacterium]UYN85950.1 MAG: BatA domain-containing protein [Cyclobacteriaceae bacterium]
MSFLNPIWLWGLTGLLIPVAIHLLSRKEGNVIRLGSVRHIMDSASARFSSIRLNEIWLLLIRCLLLLFIILLLSGLYFSSESRNSKKWILVEKGLERDTDFMPLVDSLQDQGFELRYLYEGFPVVDDDLELNGNINYWLLAQALQAESVERAVVLSNNYLKNFTGQRINLPDNIRWITKSPTQHEFELASIDIGEFEWKRTGSSSGLKTQFSTQILESSKATVKADTLSIILVSEIGFEYDKKIMLAALQAIQQTAPFIFINSDVTISEYSPTHKTDWVIWLSDRKPEVHDVSMIAYNTAEIFNDQVLFEQVTPTYWRLNTRLNEGVALNSHLTIRLSEILLPVEMFVGRLEENDRRTLPEQAAWSSLNPVSDRKTASVSENLNMYWMVLICFTLIIERLLALKRNQ